MKVLGIESTCDETSAAIVEDGNQILSHVIASQTEHAQFGGVFPELASRLHLDLMLPVIEEALIVEPDVIAVAEGPGLMGAILMGVSAAKALALAWDKPLVGVNHIEAHLYAAMMKTQVFPALGVVISGGHTLLLKMESVTEYEVIGRTVDDSIGEAFDKVSKMMKGPYPGGPFIEKLAKEGNPNAFGFKGGHVKRAPLNFSFSGLKTNVLYTLRENPNLADVAASFQRAAFFDLMKKMKGALETFDAQAIYFGGGVSNSLTLKDLFIGSFDQPVFFPPKDLSLDNGAMIAGLGYHIYQRYGDQRKLLEPYPRNPLYSASLK